MSLAMTPLVMDHPRRCGALFSTPALRRWILGSSPQVRGTLAISARTLPETRIIPAGAGHLSRRRRIVGLARDHPRRCGALMNGYILLTSSFGSSPQVRGTSPRSAGLCASSGIIPAGAGHLESSTGASKTWRDHPRRCGALLMLTAAVMYAAGSPPQVRGTWVTGYGKVNGEGIIPAGAGHFIGDGTAKAALRDHPRRCGALLPGHIHTTPARGSSPQVRGTSECPWL